MLRELRTIVTHILDLCEAREHCSSMTNRFVPEVRYDLRSDIALLDGDSQLGLLDLAVVWADRNADIVSNSHEAFELTCKVAS